MLTAGDVASFNADGFVTVGSLIDPELIEPLRERFERLFCGDFETGISPDEVNWLSGRDDPTLTRQICNGWKADRLIATTVFDTRLGEALATLAGWPGARIIQDNVLWKPPGARSVGFHRDNAYLAWYTPTEMSSCWIALDDTAADGGTMEIARGSHRWPTGGDQMGEFHSNCLARLAQRDIVCGYLTPVRQCGRTRTGRGLVGFAPSIQSARKLISGGFALADHDQFASVAHLAEDVSGPWRSDLAEFRSLTPRDGAMLLYEGSNHLALLRLVEPLSADKLRWLAKPAVQRCWHVIGACLALASGFQHAAPHEGVQRDAGRGAVHLKQRCGTLGGDPSLSSDFVQRQEILQRQVLPSPARFSDVARKSKISWPRPDPRNHRVLVAPGVVRRRTPQ